MAMAMSRLGGLVVYVWVWVWVCVWGGGCTYIIAATMHSEKERV